MYFSSKFCSGKVLFIGTGADEVLGGYSHHRKAFEQGSWGGLHAAIMHDLNGIWWKNLGRDDRLLSHWGKESRIPYLDEQLVSYLLALPLWQIVDYSQARGVGEKRLLRMAAKQIGFSKVVYSKKKAAIHHGSRSAIITNAHAGFTSSKGTHIDDLE